MCIGFTEACCHSSVSGWYGLCLWSKDKIAWSKWVSVTDPILLSAFQMSAGLGTEAAALYSATFSDLVARTRFFLWPLPWHFTCCLFSLINILIVIFLWFAAPCNLQALYNISFAASCNQTPLPKSAWYVQTLICTSKLSQLLRIVNKKNENVQAGYTGHKWDGLDEKWKIDVRRCYSYASKWKILGI